MEKTLQIIEAVGPQSLMIVVTLLLLSLLIQFTLWRRFNRLAARQKQLLGGQVEGVPLEELVVDYLGRVNGAEKQVESLRGEYRHLEEKVKGCVQGVGVVRFNAFPDTGSDLSFAIALLDDDRNGVVLSSLYGRNESRVYAKPIKEGRSGYYLTVEEEAAMAKALGE